MFRLVDGLAVELKHKRGMAGFQKVVVDVLMTSDTSVGADIEAAQVAHPRANAHRIIPIGARVSAQPRAGRAVTTFTRNAFVRVRGGSEAHWPDGLKWRMTNGAARVRLRFADSYGLGNSRRAGIEQNGKSVCMKILARPGDVLAALFARPAVTTRRFAPNCADEERALFARLPYIFGKKSCAQCKKAREKNDKATHGRPIHRARLTPPVRVVPC